VAGRTLAILLLVFAVNFMDRQLLAILIEPIREELGFSDTAAGLLYGSTFVVFYTVLGIPIARAADRSNRSRIIIWSLVLFSAMTSVCAWAGSYWHLLLARIGVGVGEAGTGPASHSIIADLYPLERRATAMGIFAMGPHLGILLGFSIGGFVGQAFGWRTPFLVAGVAGLAMTAVCAYVMKEPERRDADAGGGHARTATVFDAVRAVWRQRSLRHLFIACTVLEVAVASLVAWLPAFLMRAHGLKLSTTGALLAVVLGLFAAGGTLLGGWLSDRLGARAPAWRLRTTAIVVLLMAPVWALAIAADDDAIALVALIIAGALISFHLGPTFALVQSLTAPRMRALTASLLLFLANLVGVGIGPYLVGTLSDAWLAEYGSNSLRLALMIVPPLFLWAAAHFTVAACWLAADLQNASAASVARSDPGDAVPVDHAGAHFR
jgi:predicted MFS family arabinose efflux permease